MELKQNDRGLYLFFPTGPEHIQQTEKELEKLRVLTGGYWTWDMWEAVSEAHEKALETMKKVKK